MTILRKARAVLFMGVLFALGFATIAVIIRVATLVAMGRFPTWHTLYVVFVPWALVGLAAGAIYASAIAFLPTRGDRGDISLKSGGVLGATGAVTVFLAIIFLFDSRGISRTPALLAWGSVIAIAGASFGGAILAIAKRGRPTEQLENVTEVPALKS